MANEIIRPSKLPPRSNPVASEVVPSDNGSVVAGVSWKDGVNAGRPMASRLEAEAGVVADKAMSPLTTKQAIDAQVEGIVDGAISGLDLVYTDDLWVPYQFSGDGVTSSFTLPREPVDGKVEVFVSGEYIQKDRYTVSGGVLTFLEAPPAGSNNIEVNIGGESAQAFAIPSNGTVSLEKLSGEGLAVIARDLVTAESLYVPDGLSSLIVLGSGCGGFILSDTEPDTETGKIKTLDGKWWLQNSVGITFDVKRSVLVVDPEVDAVESGGATASPSGEINYFNNIFSPGSKLVDPSLRVWRSTAFGHAIGEVAKEWERVEAFGSGAMRFAMYGNRNTAIGTLALQWLGNDDPGSYYHDFYATGDGSTNVNPTDPTWDAFGLEGRNPGRARSGILATTFATSRADVEGNIAVGRNAGLHLVKGLHNTFLGNNAGAHAWDTTDGVYVGARAGRDNLFGLRPVFVGVGAGVGHQEGNDDVIIGYSSASELVRGGFNTIIGGRAGRDITDGQRNVFIGWGAGQQLGITGAVNDILAIQNQSSRAPLILGNFATGRVGIGRGRPEDLTRGTLAVITNPIAGSVNSSADELVVMNNANAGITVLTPNTAVGELIFADPDDNNVGGVLYFHDTDNLALRAGDQYRVWVSAQGIGFNGATAIPKPTLLGEANDALTTQALVNDIRAKLISYGLAN